MKKYKVGLIDDERQVIDTITFFNSDKLFEVNSNNVSIEVVEVELQSNINDIIEDIANSDLSAILVDFMLSNTRRDINFDGAQIINALQNIRKEFPCFILTSYQAEAENSFIDVNKVYLKKEYIEDITKSKTDCLLNRRIVRQIQNYELYIENLKEELFELKNKKDLSLKEKERIIEIDTIIEQRIDASSSIPLALKDPETMSVLLELLSKTNILLDGVKKHG